MKNVTLSIPNDLLEKSRKYAARHGTSLNELIRNLLRRNVTDLDKSPVENILKSMEEYKFSDESGNGIAMNSMRGKVFLDTNILIYGYFVQDETKQARCFEILKNTNVNFVISTQVLKEFANTMLTKFHRDPRIVKLQLREFESFEIVQINNSIICDAIDLKYYITFHYGIL